MKGNERNFAFISFQQFFGISVFQWVTVDSNKKIPRSVNSRPGLCETPLSEMAILFLSQADVGFRWQNYILLISGFVNKLLAGAAGGRPPNRPSTSEKPRAKLERDTSEIAARNG